LAQRLGNDQPFWGLTFRASDVEDFRVPYSIPEIAHCFTEAVREVQADGPYFLAGHCLSGLVAFEVATQLTAAGQSVQLLTLVEAENPAFAHNMSTAPQPNSRTGHHLSVAQIPNQMKQGLRQMVAFLQKGVRQVRSTKRTTSSSSSRRSRQSETESLDYIQDILRILALAAVQYKPKPYSGPVALFRSSQPAGDSNADPQYGWGGIVRGALEVHQIPGDHMSIMSEPHVAVLANRISSCLRRAGESTFAEGPDARAS
jgi:thioesterase domain-containing protein